MKINLKTLVLLAILPFLSCDNDQEKKDVNTSNTFIESEEIQNEPCGDPIVVTLWAGQNYNAGNLTIYNDADSLYVTYETINGWEIQKTHLFVGDCEALPRTNSGNPQIGLFPYSTIHSPRVTSFTYTLPLNNFNACFCIAAHAELVKVDDTGSIIQTETGWAEGDSIGGNSWAMQLNYCKQTCNEDDNEDEEEDCIIVSGDYRTQTQGGWGSTPKGNNPGKFLNQNFNTAFPDGLKVGCNDGYTLFFDSANTITTFLPQGGTPAILNTNYTNPTTLNNVLAGQIVALTLSVQFDLTFTDFGNASGHLEDLIIAYGTFEGWTVAELLTEANLVFGNCSSNYSASAINEALSSINENFVDGNFVGDYLTCNTN